MAPAEVTPSIVWWPVKVLAASVRAIVAEVVGKVIVVASVPARVRLLFAVSVLRFAIVSVALPAGAVIATLFILVAEAAPNVGVTKVGDAANTAAPLPVSSLKAPDKFADVNTPRDVTVPTLVTMPVKFGIVDVLPSNF